MQVESWYVIAGLAFLEGLAIWLIFKKGFHTSYVPECLIAAIKTLKSLFKRTD